MNTWKDRVYASYMTNGFSHTHASKKNLELQCRYFERNYLRFLPKNRDVRILEIGCGMGEFYIFLKRNGYKNYTGIDASVENISFIKKEVLPKIWTGVLA